MPGEIISAPAAAAVLGGKLLYEVCGPTAKYLGGKLASYTEVGVQNLKRIFENAAKQIKAQNKTEGQVPSRVLKEILSEGYFCEDELQAMYLGGVLASSKSPVSRDDRAISYCSLVSSLSSYQLRTHCILYTALFKATHYRIGSTKHAISIIPALFKYGLTVCIREADYQTAMEFSTVEQSANIAQHSFVGLEKRGLSEGGIIVVQPRQPKDGDVPFRYFYPTILGVELFLWGQGIGDCGFSSNTPESVKKLKLPLVIEPYEVFPNQVSFS